MANLRRFDTRLNRYLVVGGTAFVCEYTSFILLYRVANMKLILANGISFCIGLFTSFFLNRLWTFATKNYQKKAAHQFGYYVSLAVFNLLATLLLVSAFKSLGINPNIGKLMAMAITSTWNFLFFQKFIFKHAQ